MSRYMMVMTKGINTPTPAPVSPAMKSKMAKKKYTAAMVVMNRLELILSPMLTMVQNYQVHSPVSAAKRMRNAMGC